MNELITNGTEIKQRIIYEINNAKNCIYIAMAWFTDREIAMTLIEAKNKNSNLTIDVILSSNIQNETVKLMLKGANISIHAFETGDNRGIMHHKFCLIDNKISINGSYNYSLNASNNNVENIQVSDDITTYSQFLSEFERLKYNIDNNIGANEIIKSPETKTQQVQPINIIDTFSQQLHNLVYSSAQINTEEYKKKGFETSNESKGNIDIFRAEYNNINEEIKTYATDEGLNSKKNTLITNISSAFESTKTNLEIEKQDKISIEKRNNELEKRHITDKIVNLKKEKSIFESGNQNTGEKGLLQINKEIEKNKLERRTLEQSFVVKQFWSVGSSLVVLVLGIVTLYLSIFFSSAIYKVFFELNSIQATLKSGLTPSVPQLVDANAILKIFSQQGVLFGFLAAIFFIFPVLLSNLKILGSKKKWVNNLAFLAGLFVFDILVSSMVTINTDEIKALIKGQNSTIEIWEVVKHVEFWLIFVFGMFPLIITHFLIDNIINTYNKSRREIVDSEKNRKIQFLDEEMIEFNADKESLTIKVKEKEDLIDENNKSVLHLETEFNSILNQIENKYTELLKQLKSIFDALSAKIVSGRIFTDVIFDTVITAYKSGFIEYLPKFYASNEVANRVIAIEQTISI